MTRSILTESDKSVYRQRIQWKPAEEMMLKLWGSRCFVSMFFYLFLYIYVFFISQKNNPAHSLPWLWLTGGSSLVLTISPTSLWLRHISLLFSKIRKFGKNLPMNIIGSYLLMGFLLEGLVPAKACAISGVIRFHSVALKIPIDFFRITLF